MLMTTGNVKARDSTAQGDPDRYDAMKRDSLSPDSGNVQKGFGSSQYSRAGASGLGLNIELNRAEEGESPDGRGQ